MSRPSIGLMFFRTYPPETLPDYARMIEQSGLDELWVVEDCFFNGGVSAASVALAVTERIQVGIGILPAVVRNAAYAAMDLATLARIFPGRLHVGLGHGVADWIRQVGQVPVSQMAALEEVTVAIRDILQGQTVTMSGKHVHLDKVRLDHPPTVVPPISLGVTGPKSLALSGRIADGTILVELTGPALVCRNREVIAGGADHQLTIFAYWSQDADGVAARDRLRRMLAERIRNEGLKELDAPGFADHARELLERGGVDLLAREMPDAWLDEITVSGTPEQCLAAIQRLGDASAARVVLVPPSDATIQDLTPWCRDLAAANQT
ncbi:MAG TPA: LLM class flavin-dependent oxidoreductase [Thermomicrobiales bacterium]|jgi:alkanesulfonate monooxygenase SsuD/methylene tetrahydromethanopterin reductase-like flavin-dependent oxidoreductase (luciferase family)|nr:LLM class flavin-dependent oxidoreductase [Thermomicrobiales bacterium]